MTDVSGSCILWQCGFCVNLFRNYQNYWNRISKMGEVINSPRSVAHSIVFENHSSVSNISNKWMNSWMDDEKRANSISITLREGNLLIELCWFISINKINDKRLLNLSDCAVCVDWIWHILLLFNYIIKMSNYKQYAF